MSIDRNHRNKTARKNLMVTDMPAEIRAALVADAREHDLSVNETAVRILCDAYKVKHEPTANGLRGHQGPPAFTKADVGTHDIVIRGGAKLHRKLDVARARRGGTLRGIVLETLALHYDLTPPDIGRRPRRAKETSK